MPRYSICKICGVLTTGSTGASGIYWPFLCQGCKNKEDAALAEQVARQAQVINAALTMLGAPRAVPNQSAS